MKLDRDTYKLLLAYADCDMCVKRMEKVVFLTGTAIYNRFKKIKQDTGLNPRRFWDLIQLLECEIYEQE